MFWNEKMTLQLIHSPGLLPVVFTCPHSLETPDVSHVIFGSCYRPRHPSCLLIIKSRMLQICELNLQYLFDFVAQIICRRCLLEPMPSKKFGATVVWVPLFWHEWTNRVSSKNSFRRLLSSTFVQTSCFKHGWLKPCKFQTFLQKTWPNKTQHSPQNRA